MFRQLDNSTNMTEASNKPSLPFGWIVKTSKIYPDRIYYFNTCTGSSTWKCPELDPPRLVTKECHGAKDPVLNNLLEASTKLAQLHEKPATCSSLITQDKHNNESLVPCSSYNHSNAHSPCNSGEDSCQPTPDVTSVLHEKNTSLGIQKSVQNTMTNISGIIKDGGTFMEKKQSENTTSSKVKKKILLKCRRKKKKISPLDQTASELKRSLKAKYSKLLKKFADSLKKSSDRDNSEIPGKESSDEEVQNIETLDVSMKNCEDLKTIKEPTVHTYTSYYIVVDTNVLISQLHHINELKETPVNRCGPPHIFVPWVVIQELDKLKMTNSNNKQNTMRAASEAVRYLNSVLGKHPRVHGQSPAEAHKWAQVYSKCNDDRLLECCRGLADKISQEKVILLTNDKNLMNKALICEINVHNWTSLMENLTPDVNVDFSLNKNKRNAEKGKIVSTKNAEEKKLQNKLNMYCSEIHTIMRTARQLLKTVLEQFLRGEMYEVYGPKWLNFPIERHLLEGMLDAVITYWRMVFSPFMNQNDKKNFQSLYEKAVRPAGFVADKSECESILSTIADVFQKINKMRPRLDVPLKTILDLQITCVDHVHNYSKIKSTIEEEEKSSTQALLNENWNAINQLCGIFLDFCGIAHDLDYNKPKETLSKCRFHHLLCNLYPGVQQLKKLLFIILESIHKNIPDKNAIKKLADALLNLIPSLGIPYEEITYPYFSAEALERFCYCSENRKIMEIGCKQIENFFSKLDAVFSFIMSSEYDCSDSTN